MSSRASVSSRVLRGHSPASFGMPELSGPSVADVARTEADAIEREAYEKGFASGEKAGMEVGREKAEAIVRKLEALVQELAAIKENTRRELKPQVFDLAMAVAMKIMRQQLSERPESVAPMIQEALRLIGEKGKITVRLGPALGAVIQEISPGLTELHPDIQFVMDGPAGVQGPMVTGPEAEVLVDIESQMKNLREDMEGLHGDD